MHGSERGRWKHNRRDLRQLRGCCAPAAYSTLANDGLSAVHIEAHGRSGHSTPARPGVRGRRPALRPRILRARAYASRAPLLVQSRTDPKQAALRSLRSRRRAAACALADGGHEGLGTPPPGVAVGEADVDASHVRRERLAEGGIAVHRRLSAPPPAALFLRQVQWAARAAGRPVDDPRRIRQPGAA